MEMRWRSGPSTAMVAAWVPLSRSTGLKPALCTEPWRADRLGMPRSVVSWKPPEKAWTLDCLTLATSCSGVIVGRSGVAADDRVGTTPTRPMAIATATGASQRSLRAREEAGIWPRVCPCHLKIWSERELAQELGGKGGCHLAADTASFEEDGEGHVAA